MLMQPPEKAKENTQNTSTGFVFQPDSAPETMPQTAPAQSSGLSSDNDVSWTASEFVDHQKGAGWFLIFGLVVLALAGGVFLVTNRDIFSSIIIVVVGAVFGFIAGKKPSVLEYGLGQGGISVGKKKYLYQEFKFFYVHDDGPVHSLVLMPMRRFMPPISIFYPPEDEDSIVKILSDFLPMEMDQNDKIDQLMRKIRF